LKTAERENDSKMIKRIEDEANKHGPLKSNKKMTTLEQAREVLREIRTSNEAAGVGSADESRRSISP